MFLSLLLSPAVRVAREAATSAIRAPREDAAAAIRAVHKAAARAIRPFAHWPWVVRQIWLGVHQIRAPREAATNSPPSRDAVAQDSRGEGGAKGPVGLPADFFIC